MPGRGWATATQLTRALYAPAEQLIAIMSGKVDVVKVLAGVSKGAQLKGKSVALAAASKEGQGCSLHDR